jgi:hypothetical protein
MASDILATNQRAGTMLDTSCSGTGMELIGKIIPLSKVLGIMVPPIAASVAASWVRSWGLMGLG